LACRDDDDASAADCEDEIIEDSATAAADARLQHCSIVIHVAAMLCQSLILAYYKEKQVSVA